MGLKISDLNRDELVRLYTEFPETGEIMTDIIPGLQAIIDNSEGRLYDAERTFLRNAINHIHGMRAVAGKASGGGSFREMTAGIPRRSDEPKDASNEAH